MLKETSNYLIEDPSVYEYDSLYDNMAQTRKEVEAMKKKNVFQF